MYLRLMMRGVMGWGFLVYSYADFSSEKIYEDIIHTVNQTFLHHSNLIKKQ